MSTHLTSSQIITLKESFAMYDKDNSGTISKEELGELCMNFDAFLTESELQNTIQAFDTNRDEQIDFEEFMMFIDMKMKSLLSDTEIYEAFKMYDADDNGYITSYELAECMMKLGWELKENEVEEMIQLADKNGDHQVDFEEFKVLMAGKNTEGEDEDTIEHADKNEDNQVHFEEFEEN